MDVNVIEHHSLLSRLLRPLQSLRRDVNHGNRRGVKYLSLDGKSLPVLLVSVDLWPRGKSDPTEYQYDWHYATVRQDYDYVNDPHGWLRHELAHYTLDIEQVADNGKVYPTSNIEQIAYSYQFEHLRFLGHSDFDKVLRLIGKHHYHHALAQLWKDSM
jgi:hypothetical protein